MEYTKQILAMLREGDFAHPGEIEAIELSLSPIAKNSEARVLDVGCGLGGTAHYVQKKGWGTVTGVDIDSDLIDRAKTSYPDVQFICDDILKSTTVPHKSFQCIYSFSAFFCFTSQEIALKKLSQLSDSHGRLVLFDYSRPDVTPIQSPFPWSKTASHFNPIYLPELKKQLSATGWRFNESVDLTEYFIRWYTLLLHSFEQKREQVAQQFGQRAWDILYSGFKQLLRDLNTKKIGGIVVYASLNHA
ncbi:TPA: trans-aconitate 2-methyltransferase [Legionella bozemanae]|uniref:Trans-aconitate methyltransferase n=4 Tax=Legionellaceae TaxID=444 RepID=A0A0W0RFH8_LEGBO|nr:MULTISPECIES: methyltransferase domain-containing protein [Legionellaceae]KTC69749.1 trans-aconitate methyltransferase [Legionella bozemanae]MCW8485134.1 methyltransferase domain-containing protein [Fluoribacter dumoffii]BAF92685.1 putative methyltransferase [Fluoribacter dumoffii Tex-KL]STP13975.1 trans-aconitate 2-methyltransferase [Legionella bozemanae]